MTNNLQKLIFDADNTLFDFDRAEETALVISEDLGVAKPDPKIFAHACDLMNWSDPSQILMVGDNYLCDVQGAAGFGMRTCWFNIRQQAHDFRDHDHEIHRFDELLKLF